MLFVKLGQNLIRLDAVDRLELLGGDDALRVHFAGGSGFDLPSAQGTALLAAVEQLWKRERRLEVVLVQVGGGNGDGTVPQRQDVRAAADDDGGGAGAPRHGHPQGAGVPAAGEGVRGDEHAAGEQPLFAPERRADQPAPPRRRRARSGGAAA